MRRFDSYLVRYSQEVARRSRDGGLLIRAERGHSCGARNPAKQDQHSEAKLVLLEKVAHLLLIFGGNNDKSGEKKAGT